MDETYRGVYVYTCVYVCVYMCVCIYIYSVTKRSER